MVSSHVSSLQRSWWLALSLGVVLLSAEAAQAQRQQTNPMRGPPLALRPGTVTPPFPQPGAIIFGPAGGGANGNGVFPQVGQRYTAQLMPGKPPIPLLNNGNLSTWINPNPRFPNQIQFSYQATLPEGDRLAKNGIVDDPNLLPVLGYSPILPLPYGPGATVPGFQLGALAPIDANVLNIMGDNFNRRRVMAYQMALAQAQARQLQAFAVAAAMQQQMQLQQAVPAFQNAAPVGFGNGNANFAGFGGMAAPVKDKVKANEKEKDKDKEDTRKDDKKFGPGFAEKKDL